MWDELDVVLHTFVTGGGQFITHGICPTCFEEHGRGTPYPQPYVPTSATAFCICRLSYDSAGCWPLPRELCLRPSRSNFAEDMNPTVIRHHMSSPDVPTGGARTRPA